MDTNSEPVYSRNVVEFVAVANEFCKYSEHASELKGDELLKIFQRILPLMYLKASLLPQFDPFFEEGNEKFVTESDWLRIHDTFREKFGTADDYLEVFDDKMKESEGPVISSISENMADIYQDMKDFLSLYQKNKYTAKENAISIVCNHFNEHWGPEALKALIALHELNLRLRR